MFEVRGPALSNVRTFALSFFFTRGRVAPRRGGAPDLGDPSFTDAAGESGPWDGPMRMEGAAVWSDTSRLRTPSGIESRGGVVLGPYAWPVDSGSGVMCVCVRRGKEVGSEPDPFRRAGPELLGFRVAAQGDSDGAGVGGEGSVAALAFRTSLCRILPRVEGAREATCVARTWLGGGCAQALEGEAVAVSFRGDAEDAVAVFSARTGAMVAWGKTPGKRITSLAEWGDAPASWMDGRRQGGDQGMEFGPMLVGHADGSVVCVACGGDVDGTPWSSFPDATNTLKEHASVPLGVRMETLPRVRGKKDPVTCLASSGGMVLAGHESGAVSAWGVSARDGRWAEGGAVAGTGTAAVELRVARLAGGATVEVWVRREDGNGNQGMSVYLLNLEGGTLGGGGSAVEIAVPRGRKVLGLSVLPAVECPGFRPALGNPDSVASVVVDESRGGLALEVYNLPTPQDGGGPQAATTVLGDLGLDFSAGESLCPFPFALPGGCAIRGDGVANSVEAVLCAMAVEDPGAESRRDPSPDSLKVALLRVGVEPAARGVLRRCSAAGSAALRSPATIEAVHSEMTSVGVIPSAAIIENEAIEDRITRMLHEVFTAMLDHGQQGAVAEYVRTVCFDDSRGGMYRDATEMLLQDPRHVLGDALSPSGEPLWFGYAGMVIDRARVALTQTAAAYFGSPSEGGVAASGVYRPGEFPSGAEGTRVDASYVARPLIVRLASLEQVLVECEQILGVRPGLGERWSALVESTKQRRHECRLAISQSRVVELLLRECFVRASVPRPGSAEMQTALSGAENRRSLCRAAIGDSIQHFHAATTVMGAFRGGFAQPKGSLVFSDRMAPGGAAWTSLLEAANAFASGASDRAALESKVGALAHFLFDLGHGPESDAVADVLRIGRDAGTTPRSTVAIWAAWLMDQGRDQEATQLLFQEDSEDMVAGAVPGMDEHAGIVSPAAFTLRLVLAGRAGEALELTRRSPPSLASCTVSESCAYASALFEGGLLAEAIGLGRRRAGLLHSSLPTRTRLVEMRTIVRHVTGLCVYHFLGNGATKVPAAYGGPGAALAQLFALPLDENEERTALAGLFKCAHSGAGGDPGAAAKVGSGVLLFYMQGHREMEALSMQKALKPVFDREKESEGGVENKAALMRHHPLYCMRKALSRVQQRMNIPPVKFGAFFMEDDDSGASNDVEMEASMDSSATADPSSRMKFVPIPLQTDFKSPADVLHAGLSSWLKVGEAPPGEVTESWALHTFAQGLQPPPFVQSVRCPQTPSRFTPASMDPKGQLSSEELWNPDRKVGMRSAARRARRSALDGAARGLSAAEFGDAMMAEVSGPPGMAKEGSPIPAYQPSPPRGTPAFGAVPPFQPVTAGGIDNGTPAGGIGRTRSRLSAADTGIGAPTPSEPAAAVVALAPPAQSPPSSAATPTPPKSQSGLKGRIGMLRQGGGIALRTPPRTTGRRSVFGRTRQPDRGTPGGVTSKLAPGATATTPAPAASAAAESGASARAALPMRTRSLLKSPGK